jgi:Asp-tRNA(Asn)/Glu-tRNA(Gln) amidotransferase A subunit family amidase
VTGLLGGVDALTLRAMLADGELSCAEVAGAFLSAVGDDDLNLFAALDPAQLLADAAALDRVGASDRLRLALFGLPVAIKDNFDTADLTTTYGSPIYEGHRPSADSRAVALLRAAGALIAGKTKCAEFAWMHPTDTLNPVDYGRTPGGSSSGSAAGVAAGVIPVATGTQTAGSINRPASYCGTLGYKPTFALLPREGVKQLSLSLDTVGLFAATVPDLRVVASVLAADAWTAQESEWPPRLALMRTPLWSRVEPEAQEAIEAVVRRCERMGAFVEEVESPPGFEHLAEAQRTIQWYESGIALAPELAAFRELLSDELKAALEEGVRMPSARYGAARQASADHRPALISVLERYDGVLTPSTTGVPPAGHAFTGDPLHCRVWTLIGAPSVSVPLAWTDDGLPAGLQVVGAPGRDDRTLTACEWLMETVH